MDSAVRRAVVPEMPFEGNGEDSQLLDHGGEAHRRRKAALDQKCDRLLENLAGHQESYQRILLALQRTNQELASSLKEEILHIKSAIPHLEKKTIKRIKLVGTLRDLHKHSMKIIVRPELARKNDLYRIDDFLIRSFRTLNYLNTKKHQKIHREED